MRIVDQYVEPPVPLGHLAQQCGPRGGGDVAGRELDARDLPDGLREALGGAAHGDHGGAGVRERADHGGSGAGRRRR
ncbi:hypothetical protein [Nocardioides convexus]|uniref:hypothetical protein n=1 Tax=Nocardioides convexus TaxID=2712224 RepID=UPI002418B129|nr:hypothetical protein [Nocardioides convexus]